MSAISVLSQAWWSASEGGWWFASVSVITLLGQFYPALGTRIRSERRSWCEQLCECVRVRASVVCVQREQATPATDGHRAVDEKAFTAALTSWRCRSRHH